MTALKKTYSLLAAGVVLGTAGFIAKPANATLGMYMHCQGTYNCGMGGAGLAMSQDAISASNNPALGGKMDSEASIAAGWFWADVSGDVNNQGGQASGGGYGFYNNDTGPQDSSADNFPTGSMAANYRVDDKVSANIAIYPGGGGGSEFKDPRTANSAGGSSGGTVDSTDQGVEYMSLHAQPSLAYKLDKSTTLGVGAVLSYSRFRGDALGRNFARANNVDAWENFLGAGVHIGAVWDINDDWSVAASYRSKIWHETMSNYNTQFNGAINQPPITAVGVVHKIGDTTIAGDYKHLAWGSIDTIGRLKASEGGFGWDDQDVVALGIEQQISPELALRAGWTYGNSPLGEDNVFGSFLFPAVTTHHLNVGASYALGGMDLGASAYWAPQNSVSDNGSGDAYSQMGKGTVLEMSQYGFQMSLSKDF